MFNMKSMTGKSMVAMAMVAFLCFGALGVIAADGADAAAPVRDPVEYGYEIDDGDLYAIMDFDLPMFLGREIAIGDIYTAAAGEDPATGFVVDVYDRYAPDAAILVEFGYTLERGIDSIDKILPAYLLAYVDEDEETISVPLAKASDASLVLTIYGYEASSEGDVAFNLDTTHIYVEVLVGEDVGLYTEEEVETAIEAAIELTEAVMQEKLDEANAIIAEKNLALEADALEIADLEKQLEAAKKATGGDATFAWCIAALGIIAAGVLGGFTALAAVKAKKEGRRFI